VLAGLVKQLVERDGVLRIWGMAAGQLIASEAGLDCVNLDRMPWRWAAGTVAAGDRQFLSDLF
jgi:fructose-1,6-bisphosphatase/inositol monophosphatase family enzyme